MNIENRNLTPEIKGRTISWIRGALLGMIGITVLLLLAVGKWNCYGVGFTSLCPHSQ